MKATAQGSGYEGGVVENGEKNRIAHGSMTSRACVCVAPIFYINFYILNCLEIN